MSQFNQTKIEKKRRQGQKKSDGKTATPKPVCPKCGEILRRTYTREPGNGGKRCFKGSGWSCPSSTCDCMIKDYVVIADTEEDTEEDQEEQKHENVND